MPSHPCKHPTCTTYIAMPGFCAEHIHLAPADHREQHRDYDQHRRDPEAKKFYDSATWQRTRARKLETHPTCQRCGRFAEHVHHVIPVKIADDAQRIEQDLLESLCHACHSQLE